MDDKGILRKLEEAAGKDKGSIPSANLFGSIGFDGDNARLGWVVPPNFSQVKESLKAFTQKSGDKEEFIFVGMGGSANGIKTLIQLTNSKSIYVLDSLDPEAIGGVLANIKDLEKVLVCPISKSGTTKETQLIARTLKDAVGNNWQNHFLWIADKSAFSKLDNSGWSQADKISIQPDNKEDIGGRFTCPHTLIFLAPLFIALGRDFDKLGDFWGRYISVIEKAREDAASLANEYSRSDGEFQINVRKGIHTGITNWIIQLFQESLGSKAGDFYPKTIVTSNSDLMPGFDMVDLKVNTRDLLVYTAGVMHALQVFVAVFAYLKNINFVNQPYVEIYKKELKNIQNQDMCKPQVTDLQKLTEVVAQNIGTEHKFIDVVLYFKALPDFKEKIKNNLSQTFGDRHISIFEGSDWNHHSYQAAFKDIKSFFVVVVRNEYKNKSDFANEELIRQDYQTLKSISKATYKTLKDKALYFSVTP